MRTIQDKLVAKWFVCRITSGRKSVQYGLRFSYPLYISLVVVGVVSKNPYLLSLTALIALLGIILPMHPFDYVYNYSIAKIMNINKIPGRGSELQMNSIMALFFNVAALVLMSLGIQLNYLALALVYTLISIFFIFILLRNDDFSIYSFLPKKNK